MNARCLLTALLALSSLAACGSSSGEQEDGPSQSLCPQPNYLANPSFSTEGPDGSTTTVTTSVPGGAGNSAAADWSVMPPAPPSANGSTSPPPMESFPPTSSSSSPLPLRCGLLRGRG